MSVAVQLPLSSLPGPAYDEDDVSLINATDWGTATPVNSIHEVEFDDFSNAITKRGIRHKSLQAAREEVPKVQNVLLLREARQRFSVVEDYAVPEIRSKDEVLVKINSIGLNPIDWKSADFGWGIPTLPYVAGRDFAGTVVRPPDDGSNLELGDIVLCPSTDYRDLRKAAYQQYAIASSSNLCRLPKHISVSQGASLGVAYVAAALALGVCLGMRFPAIGEFKGPNLLEIVRKTPLGRLPRDVVSECIAIEEKERPVPGEWIVIWGGSSTSALFLSQMACMAGLKVVLVLDVAKHASRLLDTSDCIYVDSNDSARASQVIQGIAGDGLRLGIDTVGQKTSESLARSLRHEKGGRSHLVGIAALPKERLDGVIYHSLPVKLFHEVPEVGQALMTWLEHALESQALELPRVDEIAGGLEGINGALDLMRSGTVSGKRLVVPI